MSYQIIRSHVAPDTVEAVLEPIYRERRSFLFGPNVGKITVLQNPATGSYLFQVICPCWEPNHSDTEGLRKCYAKSMKLAADKGLKSMAIPLPDGGAQVWALRAVQAAIAACREASDLEIFLLAGDGETNLIGLTRRRELESYFSRKNMVRESGYSDALPNQEERHFPEPPSPMSAPRSLPMQAKATARERGRGTGIQKSELEQLLRRTDAGFSETLLRLIDKTGKKDSEIYNKANVSRQHFSKIRNNPDYKPTKPTAIAFAIALELDMAQTQDLIGRAGYTLTTSSKFDMIIMYFIENNHYDLFDINTTLYEYDQSLLGA